MKTPHFYFCITFLFIALCAVPNLAQHGKTVAPERVWELTYLKARQGQSERLVQFIEKNWFALDKIAAEQKLINSYRLIKNKNVVNQNWDAVVAVEYLNPLGYNGIKKEFEKIRAAHQTILIDGLQLSDLGSIVKSEKTANLDEKNLWNNRAQPANYAAEIVAWREKRRADLQSEDGWLSLAGLFWLKTGANTVGAAAETDVILPAEKTPAVVGVINFDGAAARLELSKNVTATADGAAFTTIELKSDDGQKPTIIQIGDIKFNLIKRGEQYGIRVKNPNNPARREFAGLHWFPVQESFRITARFEPYPQPKKVRVPNVLGDESEYTSPGVLTFKIGGAEYKLEPVTEEDGKLFIIFRDLTARTTTYQAGRFLSADAPAANNIVVLDFNKAYNPPCAFTKFATCPLPPAQNRLAIEIPAGEKRYHQK